jgi:uncharacterized protein (DUF2235 family)
MARWGGTVGVARNIVICCDGTGNEIDANLSNVLKLFRIVRKNDDQIVFYDPGVGTISSSDPWSRLKSDAFGVWGLLTGYGLDENVLEAYRFLLDTYENGDRIYMFGFSRGAYTVRLLAGFLRLVGLLERPQRNLCEYALTAFKRAAEEDDFEIAWRFERVASTRRIPIAFIGVWDTVSSVIVPRPDRLYLPSLQELPYTKTNSYVEVFRHAIAIDERRRMFRINRWTEPQTYKPNPFSTAEAPAQDIKQVWFAGVHSDIGGGYSETESGAAKYPLRWMIDEAVIHGLQISKSMYDHLVLGHPLPGGKRTYTAPDFTAKLHSSMNWAWSLLEGIPKRAKRRDWPQRQSVLGWYLPLCEPRRIDDGALVHHSVFDRVNADPNYRPVNLPSIDRVNIEGSAASLFGAVAT